MRTIIVTYRGGPHDGNTRPVQPYEDGTILVKKRLPAADHAVAVYRRGVYQCRQDAQTQAWHADWIGWQE